MNADETDPPFDPQLRGVARLLPHGIRPAHFRVATVLSRLIPDRRRIADVRIERQAIPGPTGAPAVQVRVYRPDALPSNAGALVWMHGGGFVGGNAKQDEGLCAELARALAILVVSVDYRLAPADPFPAALEDAYASLRWLTGEAASLGVDPERIAIGGESAGGGLAAQLALLAVDRGELAPCFQLLSYPMLDDRTATRPEFDHAKLRLWDQRSNAWGWRSYLGLEPGDPRVPPLAAPSRRDALEGLPPAWIGVGTLDLFLAEDLAYSERLRAAGVACTLQTYAGGFHAFNRAAPWVELSRRYEADRIAALRAGLVGAQR